MKLIFIAAFIAAGATLVAAHSLQYCNRVQIENKKSLDHRVNIRMKHSMVNDCPRACGNTSVIVYPWKEVCFEFPSRAGLQYETFDGFGVKFTAFKETIESDGFITCDYDGCKFRPSPTPYSFLDISFADSDRSAVLDYQECLCDCEGEPQCEKPMGKVKT